MDSKQATAAASDFRTEFLECWKRLPDKWLFFGLLAAWLLLFQFLGNPTFGYINTPSLMYWMGNSYIHGDFEEGHGFLVPIAVLALFWMKRNELLALPQRNWLPGLFLLAGALALHVLGYLVQQPRISIVGFFTGIYALMG